MSNKIFKNVSEWFSWAYLRRKASKPISIDLDYFALGKIEPMEYVNAGVDMLNILIELCEHEDILEEIMPALSIPLKWSECILPINAKEFMLTEDDLHESTPPGLYLLNRDDEKFYVKEERYRRDIKLFPQLTIHKNCRVRYECYRDAYGIENNWQDFSRHILIEHYTNRLLLE